MAIITKFFKGAGYSDKNNVRYIARTTFVQIRTPHSERYYLVNGTQSEQVNLLAENKEIIIMKAIPKDKQIAVHAMISAPIDETNVQSDIIRRVFDNEECITRKGTYLGYVEDMAVKATIFYNNVFFTLINKKADKGIFAGTILSRITEDEYKDIYIGNSFQYICEDDDNRLVVTINYDGDGEVVVMFNLNVLSDDLVF